MDAAHHVPRASTSCRAALGAWLQAKGLRKGARVALMMPNLPQYMVAIAAVLRAGYTVVNVNPLYTPRELEHQLNDSGAEAIIVLENFAKTLEEVIDAHARAARRAGRDGRHAGFLEGPARQLRGAPPDEDGAGVQPAARPRAHRDALQHGAGRRHAHEPDAAPTSAPDDVAFLQYTGGTTGVSKGATLLHRNVVANILQAEAWFKPMLDKVGEQADRRGVRAAAVSHLRADRAATCSARASG